MGVAVVSGVFAIALAGLSWLLTNGSRRSRILTRIERQTAVIKDLPEGHPARVHIEQALLADAEALAALRLAAVDLTDPIGEAVHEALQRQEAEVPPEPIEATTRVHRQRLKLDERTVLKVIVRLSAVISAALVALTVATLIQQTMSK